MAVASIPETLDIFLQEPIVYPRCMTGEEVTCIPAFPVDSASGLHGTAKSWAENSRYVWKDGEHKHVQGVCREKTAPNSSIRQLRLVGISHRSEGGLAYKVIYGPEAWLVDFREEEFLEALFEGRIDDDGWITGDYVWSRSRQQMRIVRVGSKMWTDRKTAGDKGALVDGLKRLGVKALKPGNVYVSSNTRAIYLGRVYVDYYPDSRTVYVDRHGNPVSGWTPTRQAQVIKGKAKSKKCFAWRYLEKDYLGVQTETTLHISDSTNFKRDMGKPEEPFTIPENPEWKFVSYGSGDNIRWA